MTRDFLTKWWYPQWLRRGWQFTPDAFDSALTLRQHIKMHHRSKRLPYLAVDLGESAVEMAESEQTLTVAQSARDEVNRSLTANGKLLEDYQDLLRNARPQGRGAPGPNDIEATIASLTSIRNTLTSARCDIEELIEEPSPRGRRGAGLITRRHIIAQLMCPNDSRFVGSW
jgi:hypothetical protein